MLENCVPEAFTRSMVTCRARGPELTALHLSSTRNTSTILPLVNVMFYHAFRIYVGKLLIRVMLVSTRLSRPDSPAQCLASPISRISPHAHLSSVFRCGCTTTGAFP